MRTARPKAIKFHGAVYHQVAATEHLFYEGYVVYKKIVQALDDFGVKPTTTLDSSVDEYEKDHYGEVTLEQSFSLDPDSYEEHYSDDYTGGLVETVVSALWTAGFRHHRLTQLVDDTSPISIQFTNRPLHQRYSSGAASVIATLEPFAQQDPAGQLIPRVTISMVLVMDL